MSDKGYTDKTANHGDCILIDTGSKLVIYDCGCQEHAERVLDYMKKKRYKTADLILSHNDCEAIARSGWEWKEGAVSLG